MNAAHQGQTGREAIPDRMRRHWWLPALAIAAVFSLLVIFLVLPPLVRWGAEKWLESHGRLEARIEAVDFNLFSGNLVVHSLIAERAGGDRGGMRWGRAALELKWRPVFSRRLRLGDITLANARIDIVQEENGAVYVGGLRVREADGRQAPSPQKVDGGWEVGFGAVDLRHVVIRYATATDVFEGVIDKGHIGPFQSWNPALSSRFEMSARLGGGVLEVQGSARPLARNAGIWGRIRMQDVPLAWAAPFLAAASMRQPAGTLSADAAFDLAVGKGSEAHLQAGLEGRISLAHLTGALPAARIGPAALTWDGSLQLATAGPDGAGPRLTAEGTLVADGAHVRPSGMDLSLAAEAARLAGRFSLNAGGRGEPRSVAFEGEVTADGLQVDRAAPAADGGPLQLRTRRMIYEGLRLQADPGEAGTLRLDGRLRLDQVSGALSGVTLAPTVLTWEGALQAAAAGAEDGKFRITAEGDLTADGLQVDRAAPVADGSPLQLRTLRLTYEGLRLQAEPGEVGTLRLDGRLRLDQVSGALSGVTLAPTVLTWEGALQAAAAGGEDGNFHLNAEGDLTADGTDLRLPGMDLSLAAGAVHLAGRFSQTPGGRQMPSGMTFDGQAALEGLAVARADGTATLVRAGRMSFEGLRLQEGGPIRAGGARLTDAVLLERTEAENPASGHVLSLPAVELTSLAVDPERRRFTVDTASLRAATARVYRNAEGLEMAGLLPQVETGASPARPWSYRIGRITLDPGTLIYRDTSITPVVDLELSRLQVTARDLDSAAPDRESSLSVRFEVGEYTAFQAEGEIRPFAERVSMDVNGKLKAFNLPQVRGYAERYWGYTIESGQLYADFHLLVDRARMDSLVKLFITSLALNRLGSEEQDEFTRQLGMPLNAALDLIRDSGGNVSLELPVTGDFARPDIGFDDVIGTLVQNAALKAVKTAALSYFAPLGAVYVGSKVLGRMTALRLAPVYFAPGQADMDAGARRHLDRVAERLEDRPQTQLVICGRAVPQDRRALGPEGRETTARAGSGGESAPEAPGAAAAEERLSALAETRAEAVKSYLVSRDIDAARLALCAPDITDEDVRPQVELGL